MNRRAFLSALGIAALAPSCARYTGTSRTQTMTVSSAFDREVEAFMAARKIPGGALAVVKERRLIYTRGYGWADRDKRIPAKADSLFRIASISKPITAVAVLKLVEEGKLDLDAHAFDIVRVSPLLVS